MGASDYLSALNWGTSTGGSAGSAETTSTLGNDPLDRAQPTDVYHLSHLQMARMKNLLIAISQDLKGGTRLLSRVQSSNPFGATEAGYYVDSSGSAWLSYNGTRVLLGGTDKSGIATFTSAGTGAGHDFVDVTFTSNFSNTSYVISLGLGLTTITDPAPVYFYGSKAVSGFRIQVSDPFDGEISWKASV